MSAPRMPVARTRSELIEALAVLRRGGEGVALVPTMGALHEGHLSLVDVAGSLAGATVMSIFVNPAQFGEGEDFDRYPRDLERDLDLARERGVDLVFAPATEEIYPDGSPVVTINPGLMAGGLCGPFRPGHFEGVLTVVAKLLNLVRPDVAVFGRKDFQQAQLIRRMALDLDLGVRIEVAPTVREADGLAMSSRNRYMTAVERGRALGLSAALLRADERFREGEKRASVLFELVRDIVDSHEGLDLQYVELVVGETLEPLDTARTGAVLAVAGFSGATRLIDNVVLGADTPDRRIEEGSMKGSSP